MKKNNPIIIGKTKRLKLNKETVSKFDTTAIKGGAPKSDYVECKKWSCVDCSQIECKTKWDRTCE